MLEVTCPICGHRNPADAMTCTLCGKPLDRDRGIHRPAFCPHCGDANPVRTVNCSTCGCDLQRIERAPESTKTEIWPHCGARNLPSEISKAVFCTACGHLRSLPSFLPATPDADACPICDRHAVRVKDVFESIRKANDPLVRELAPPGKPLPLWLFGTEPEGPANHALNLAASMEVNEGLGILATGTSGTQSSSTGNDTAASSGEAVAILGVGLVVIAIGLALEAINEIRKDMAIAYQDSLTRWNSAFFCQSDRIVFIRQVNDVQWAPVDHLRDLILRDVPNS